MRPPWAWRRIPLVLPKALDSEVASRRPCLVHLVREANGLDSLRAFAAALRAHPPGIEHELVLAMKGFTSPAQARPYLAEVEDLRPHTLFFADRGFDLGVYLFSAARLRRERYCFVNSHSRPLVDGWLAKLDAALDRPGVGQVGATGAWASGHSWFTYSMGLPSAYRGVLPPLPTARRELLAAELETRALESRSKVEALRARLALVRQIPGALFYYEPFPARNLRTNVFMVTHAALRELPLFVVRSKLDAYSLEGSRESLTRMLERLGLTSLVVDRAGAVYGPERWDRSRTLWQGDQEGLLVADNQTLSYTRGGIARRQLLSSLAWGPCADPLPPSTSARGDAPGTAPASARGELAR
jgi:hypothetical protein